MSKYKWIIDAGHGGKTTAGIYTTAPGKQYTHPDPNGFTFEEGVNNRAIALKLRHKLDGDGIEYALTYDEIADTTLGERVRVTNKIHAKDPRCILVSIHSDAMPEGAHGKASGLSIWTSVGETRSDKVADIFARVYEKELQQFKLHQDRLDGDSDKEENFYILKNTDCPAVLTENLFYDNRHEAEYLRSELGQELIANALFECIKAVEALHPI